MAKYPFPIGHTYRPLRANKASQAARRMAAAAVCLMFARAIFDHALVRCWRKALDEISDFIVALLNIYVLLIVLALVIGLILKILGKVPQDLTLKSCPIFRNCT